MSGDSIHDDWQPIETAPKDGSSIMACFPRLGPVCPVKWNDDRHNRQPRPYWSHDGSRILGLHYARDNPPTHWRPLPAPAKQEGE